MRPLAKHLGKWAQLHLILFGIQHLMTAPRVIMASQIPCLWEKVVDNNQPLWLLIPAQLSVRLSSAF